MENPGLAIITNIIKAAKEKNTSDIHFVDGSPLMFRVNGELQPEDADERVGAEEIGKLASTLLNERQITELKKRGEVSGVCSIEDICRVRVTVFRQKGTYAMTMRLLPPVIPEPSELLLPVAVSDWSHQKSGLVIIAGMSGSGRSTTLASVLHSLASSENKTVVTAERLLEYLHTDSASVFYQREIGRDSSSGEEIIRSARKQDIDVAAVMEPENREVIMQSLLAAETGQLVFLNVSAGSVSGVIETLTDYFPSEQQEGIRKRIAAVLLGITVQKLLPKADGTGRVAAFAVLQTTPAVRNLIRENKMEQLTAMMQSGEEMCTMDDAIYELYMKSRISVKTAVLYAENQDDMLSKI